MNIDPKLWGPCAWDFFYFSALSFPKNPTEDDKIKYKHFFTTAGQILPCEKCRNNFIKHMNQIPLDNYLDSSYNLFTWITKMQNKVRIKSGQTERSVDENFQYFTSKINTNSSHSSVLPKKEKILIGLICFAFLLFLLKKFKKI